MKKKQQRSFGLSDFTWNDVPIYSVGFIAISTLMVILGLVVDSLPSFWAGMLVGAVFGSLLTLRWFYPRQKFDVEQLPKISPRIKELADDPDSSMAAVVKAYCDETGASLSAGTAVIVEYKKGKQLEDQI